MQLLKHSLTVLLFLTFINALFINSTIISSNSLSDNVFNSMFRAAKYAALSYSIKKDSISLGELKNACTCKLCEDSEINIQIIKIYHGKVSGILIQDNNSNEIILSLKGTTSNEEWLLNLTFFPIPYHPLNQRKKGWKKWYKYNNSCNGCTIHKGFYDGAKEIYDNLFNDLINLSQENPNYKIIITGHSLGGAIAPILANECLPLGLNPTVITFGAPKIGNTFFASWMDDIWNTNDNYNNLDNSYHSKNTPSYFRVSHKGDYVTLLPTRQMKYKHCGIDVYFDKNGLPMHNSQIRLRKSPANVMNIEDLNDDYNDDDYDDVINSNSKLSKLKESHRLYFLRMNLCTNNDV